MSSVEPTEDMDTSSSDEGALPLQYRPIQNIQLRPFSIIEGFSRLNLDDSSLPALEQAGRPFMGESSSAPQGQQLRPLIDMFRTRRSPIPFEPLPLPFEPQRSSSPFQPIRRVPQSVSTTGSRLSDAAATVSSDTTTDDDGSSDISEESDESDTGESSMACCNSSSSEAGADSTDSNKESLSSEDEKHLSPEKKQEALANSAVKKLDEDDDEEFSKQPFSQLRELMVKIIGNGKIWKMVSKAGSGDYPVENDLVTVVYKSYKEYKDESTNHVLSVTAEKPGKFKLGTNMEGLNVAVSSMQPNEIAWFLIHPDYMYGKFGFLPQIPPSTTILYKVMLISTIQCGAADDYKYLTANDKRNFDKMKRVVLGLIELARDQFKKNLDKSTRQYKRAKKLLSYKGIKGMTKTRTKWIVDRLMAVNCHLAMCYNRQLRFKRACKVCVEVLQLAKKHSLPVPIKCHFHYGRALRNINKFTRAIEQLRKAQRINPNNPLIETEIDRVKFKKLQNRESKSESKLGSVTLYLRDISKETEDPEDLEDPDDLDYTN